MFDGLNNFWNRLDRSTQAWSIIACLTLFRLVYIAFAPVTSQEVYYWLYSKHPALAYVDHPPMIAYSIVLGTSLFGDNGFGIKFMAVVWSLLTNVFLFLTVRRGLFRSSADDAGKLGILAVLLYNLTLFAHAFAVIQQPDAALLFFWVLAIFFVQEFQLTGRPANLIFAGIALGSGMLCKYTAAALLPGLLAALLSTRRGRGSLWSPYPWLAMLIAGLVFSPVIYWNWGHEWASFQMQFQDRGGEIASQRSVQFRYFFQLLGTQMAMLMPLVFVLLVRFYYRMASAWREVPEAHLYFLSGIFLIAGFILISFTTKVKVHWLLPGYLGVILGVVVAFRYSLSFRSPWIMRGTWFSLGLIGLCHALFLVPGFQIFQVNSWSGWRDLTKQIVALQEQLGGQEKVFLFADSHKTAAYLTFYSPDHQRTYALNIIGQFAKQFNVWGEPQSLQGKNALYVTSAPDLSEGEGALLEKYFDKVTRIAKFSYPLISLGDEPTRDVTCYLGTNYRLQPRSAIQEPVRARK
ncbi:MAG: glycosyltransferase family 39 protein [Methylococcaceae bacterium]|nr:glycosyltransferase family 39 protein [Methylococcaceae bacterium]